MALKKIFFCFHSSWQLGLRWQFTFYALVKMLSNAYKAIWEFQHSILHKAIEIKEYKFQLHCNLSSRYVSGTNGWSHELWTPNESFLQIFWPIGQIGQKSCEVFFLQKVKSFIHFTRFSILDWDIGDMGCNEFDIYSIVRGWGHYLTSF